MLKYFNKTLNLIKIKKLLSFTGQHRYKYIFYILSSFFVVLLETFGIGIIPAYVKILVEPEIFQKFKLTKGIIVSNKTYIILTLLLLLFFILKNSYLFFHNYFEIHLNKDTKAYLSKELFNIYLKKNLFFHLDNYPSILGRNVTSDVNCYVSYIRSFVILFREGTQLIFIAILLLVTTFEAAVVVIVLITTFSFLYYYFLKTPLKKNAKISWIYRGKKGQIRLQTLNSIIEILVYKKKDFFLKSFETNFQKEFNAISTIQLLNVIPRIVLEVLVISFFCVFLIYIYLTGYDINTFLPTVILLAVATIRIYPSYINLITHRNSLLENSHPTNHIIEHFEKKNDQINSDETKSDGKIVFQEKINIKNLDFAYPNRVSILNSVDLTINKNTAVGIVGKSGLGKTTLIHIIMGLVEPSNGAILIDDCNIIQVKKNWQKKISYLSQNTYLLEGTLKENILFGDEYDEDLFKKTIKFSSISELINKLPESIETNIGNEGKKLSSGEKQRIGLARAIYKNRDILILDEPTSNLDKQTEKEIIKSIIELKGKKTIICVSHNYKILEKFDKIYKIENKNLEDFKIN